MSTFVDYYLVLGLPTGEEGVRLTETQIIKAFQARALEIHPDKRPPAEAFRPHADFQKLNQSYQILMDVQARQEFDAFLLNHCLRDFPQRRPRRRRKMRRPQEQQQQHHHHQRGGGGQENKAAGVKRRNMDDFEKRDGKRRRAAEVEEEYEMYAKMMQEISSVLERKLKKVAALKARRAAPGPARANKPSRNRGRGRAKGDNNDNSVSRVVRISNQNPRKPPPAEGRGGARIAQVAFRGIKNVAQPQMPMDGLRIQKPSSSLDSPMAAADRLPELFARLQIQPMQV